MRLHVPDAPRFGLPARMGAHLLAIFDRDGEDRHAGRLAVIDALLQDTDRIPLTAGEGAIYAKAAAMVQECRAVFLRHNSATHPELLRLALAALCDAQGVVYPCPDDDAQAWARLLDEQFWVRALRKEFGRRFEATAIKLGLVGERIDPYITRESAARQAARNEANQKRLEETEIICEETGQKMPLAQAAKAGMGNLVNRRNELMTRIRGFEEIATGLKHRALFITITAPSKYHAGRYGTNANYAGLSPRDAQAYLVEVWARIRAQFKRDGVSPYGFRVAEPHTDGCPHWHLLLFVPRKQVKTLKDTIKAYGLAEDGDEPGAKKQRIKIVSIESGKGTAAGYIAKYIAKNIDGRTVGGDAIAHKAHGETDAGQLGGVTRAIESTQFDGRTFIPAERVRFWAQTHGIRQFQQIGGAPVGIWRELRRVQADALAGAPQVVQDAWKACQKVDSGEKDADGKPVMIQADWAAYVKAQGGPDCGRDAAIQLWKRVLVVDGRYGRYEAEKPCGVWAVGEAGAHLVKSIRYTWKRADGDAAGRITPWTGVNNCTDLAAGLAALKTMGSRFQDPAVSDWTGRELKKFDPAVDWAGLEAAAAAKEAESREMRAAVRLTGAAGCGNGTGFLSWSMVGPPTVADIVGRWTWRENQKEQ